MSDGLNPPQRDAVNTLSGPLLVLAGAGTGKTRVVTFRIANLIRHRTKPERILAVTFTRKAAGEMQERATDLLPGKYRKADAPRPEISTFHALCVRILRRHAPVLGYPERFAICDRGDQESAARAALREIRAPADSLKPSDLLGFIGRWKMASVSPSGAMSLAETDREHLAAAAYRRYQKSLKNSGVVDFDDLLLLTEQLFTKHPEVRRKEAARFDHVLIDEYQDTNHSQYEIVRGLAMGHRNLCVVGDDDQSIYGWRGAEVTHILRFAKDWPDAKVVRLEDNYRSSASIIQHANTLIAFNSERHDKVLKPARHEGPNPRILQFKDEQDEAVSVVKDIQRLMGMGRGAKDFAILFRTNEQPRAFETELRAAQLPYVLIGGMSFFDRREVRDLLAYLRLVADPGDDPAVLRVLNTPPRGIGDAARKALVTEAAARGKHVWDMIESPTGVTGLSKAAMKGVLEFRNMVQTWQELAERLSLQDMFHRILDDTKYEAEIRRLYEDPNDRDARWATVEEITNAAASYDTRRKSRKKKPRDRIIAFLDDLLVGNQDESREKEKQLSQNAIALMTLHSSKGLEFPFVYLVGLEEGILPHKRSLEGTEKDIAEERRLAYVGVTRAQDELTMTMALTRRKWGKPRETIPSRFLFEMTGQAENFVKRQRAAQQQAKGPTQRRSGAKQRR
ncbi:UvrD-helicase domain-containing protein [Aeoliella sp. ICT_H6.2]|uniref:DNA 3'-5' helicase n=1 Tax=Aeoliella straminimaris TaxID=2954799 RepID=A0A9X2FF79_9BACT|nr:UvrD-helicase domain-containing protein [Aeoliella straminimaris]MCO6044616.1 UvrD-helicase domain-containing protein [Aeoliella straminimaris]